ncbi:hypothetical protein B4U80_13614 [Leptotrombidium deliense]|uniref:EB domain-containing protein n=1 Tax=Leptotrombidium deliense TaxID=299467 RepID=A0A443STI8_9ACAR|nr:hypothetical protein B4U80_13614 [Leptotrombidium deliense]
MEIACNTTEECTKSGIINGVCVDFVCKCAKGLDLNDDLKICIPKMLNELMRKLTKKFGQKCNGPSECQKDLMCSEGICKTITNYIETTTHRTFLKPATCSDGYYWSYTQNNCVPIRRNYDSLMITVLGLIFFIVVTVICTNITNKNRDRGEDEEGGEYPVASENAASYTFDAPLPQFNERNHLHRIECVKDDDNPPSYEEAIQSEPTCPTFDDFNRMQSINR